MAVPEHELRRSARRAYELGRLRAALPAALWMAPLAAPPMEHCQQPALVIVQALLLSAALVGLRWRGQDYGRGVFPGLFFGVLGYLVPFCCCAGGFCMPGPSTTLVLLCSGAGVLAGFGLALYSLRRHERLPYLISAATVAALTAGLSCSIAGLGGMLGMALGLALGAGPVLAFRRST